MFLATVLLNLKEFCSNSKIHCWTRLWCCLLLKDRLSFAAEAWLHSQWNLIISSTLSFVKNFLQVFLLPFRPSCLPQKRLIYTTKSRTLLSRTFFDSFFFLPVSLSLPRGACLYYHALPSPVNTSFYIFFLFFNFSFTIQFLPEPI